VTLEPVEIQHVKLGKSLFGYDRDAVDQLLEEVTASFERVWLERNALREQGERLQREARDARERDRRVGGVVVSAERIAQRRLAEARKRAEALLLEAQEQAERIVAEARREPERLQHEIHRLETMEEALKARYQAFLRGAQRLLETPGEADGGGSAVPR
jgi:cell division initiation protein